jgi:hypothetical protein
MRCLATALAVAAIIGGCGAGGENHESDANATDSTPPWRRPYGLVYAKPGLTKAKFQIHFNHLCGSKWRLIQNARSSYFSLITFYIYDAIQSLGSPPDERGRVENLLVRMREGVERGERLGTANPARVQALFADYNRTARRLGLDECLVAGANLPRREA